MAGRGCGRSQCWLRAGVWREEWHGGYGGYVESAVCAALHALCCGGFVCGASKVSLCDVVRAVVLVRGAVDVLVCAVQEGLERSCPAGVLAAAAMVLTGGVAPSGEISAQAYTAVGCRVCEL